MYDSLSVSAIVDRHDVIVQEQPRLEALLTRKLESIIRKWSKSPTSPSGLSKKRCPFCKARTDIVDRYELPEDVEDDGLEAWASFESCHRCLYWRWHYLDQEFVDRGGFYVCKYKSFASKLASFEPYLPEGCSAEFAAWLHRHPRYWDEISPEALERFVADVYRANYADAEVTHLGKTADGGVDVVMINVAHERWLIQCKRRKQTKTRRGEGVETLRNLLGAMTLHDTRTGIIVSTADHFTYDAYRARKRASEVGYLVEFVDRGKLRDLIGAVIPERMWQDALRTDYSLYLEWLDRAFPESSSLQLVKTPRPVRYSVTTSERCLLTESLNYRG